MNAVKKFIVAMLVVLGLGIVFFIGYFVKSNANLKHDARNNTECKTNERVFDYADKLSDSEEETLRGEISGYGLCCRYHGSVHRSVRI